MKRTTSNKKYIRRVSGQKQREYTDTNNIQEDSATFKTHPATSHNPNKSQNKGIHDCWKKTYIHMQEFRRKLHVYATVKRKLMYRKEKRVK